MNKCEKLSCVCLVVALLGCAPGESSSKESDGFTSVSKLCSGADALQNVTGYLIVALKDQNDPKLRSLFLESVNPENGNLKEGFSLEKCRVNSQGTLRFETKSDTGVLKSFEFVTKGPVVIELPVGITGPAAAAEPVCQNTKFSFYSLTVSNENASYDVKNADKDYTLNLQSAKDLQVFSDSNCAVPASTLTLKKDTSTVPISYIVQDGASPKLSYTIDGLGYGGEATLLGAAKLSKPSVNTAEAED